VMAQRGEGSDRGTAGWPRGRAAAATARPWSRALGAAARGLRTPWRRSAWLGRALAAGGRSAAGGGRSADPAPGMVAELGAARSWVHGGRLGERLGRGADLGCFGRAPGRAASAWRRASRPRLGRGRGWAARVPWRGTRDGVVGAPGGAWFGKQEGER
jgi:hypothetical protein